MKQQIDKLLTKIAPVLNFVKKYLTFTVIIIFLIAVAFLLYRINSLSRREPTDDQVTTALNKIAKPKVDQETVDKIQQLQDQHVEVKSLFDAARSNPFSE